MIFKLRIHVVCILIYFIQQAIFPIERHGGIDSVRDERERERERDRDRDRDRETDRDRKTERGIYITIYSL